MAIDWAGLLREYGPAALEALSSYQTGRANRRATDAQIDALDEAGRLQYQTALQAMEMARLRDVQTRLDTEQPRYQGYNAMRVIAQQLGLPVYDRPFNATLDTFRPGGGGGFGGGGGLPVSGPSAPAGVFPGSPREPSSQQQARATGEQYGGLAGQAIGTYFGGPIGGAAGNAIGAYIGREAGPEIDRRGNIIGPLTAGLKIVPGPVSGLIDKFLGEGGDLATGSRVYGMSSGENATFFDRDGGVVARVKRPTEGMVEVPGLSRNGNPIFLTSEGRLVKRQQSGGGFDELPGGGFNINGAATPVEINGIIAKGYTAQAPNAAELGAVGGGTGASGAPGGIGYGTGGGSQTAAEAAPPPLPTGRYGGFQETPGYQFVLDEGLRARDKMAASRGRYFSGGTGRELERYAQGVASQEYDNYFRRLMDQVTGGNSATQFTSSAGAGLTGSAIGSLTRGADELGSAIVGAGSARGSGILAGQQIANSGVAGIAGSGIFDRLGSIFGGSGGGAKTGTASSGGAKPSGGFIYNNPLNNPYYGS